MKPFLNKITLNKNARGCYILDTVKGCKHNCYGDCYARNIACRYGMDFKNPVNRDFIKDTSQLYLFNFHDTRHEHKIIKEIENIDMPFVRIGEMGDCSENWEHTLNVCKVISQASKKIVIITKHWKAIPDKLLNVLSDLDICINTSVSALDSMEELDYRLIQYKRLKKYCNSVLRVVTCDFNTNNQEGVERSAIQDYIVKDYKYIDTVFRPSLENPLVVNGIINIKKVKFLKSMVYASVFNNNTYMGTCEKCPDMCGIR